MNCYQDMSRRLLESARAASRVRRAPYWLNQRPLLGENWLPAMRAEAPPRRGKSRH